jgi:hypothetical protein
MRTRTVTIDGTRHTIDDSMTTPIDQDLERDHLWLAGLALHHAIAALRSATPSGQKRIPTLERVLAEVTALAGRL